MSKQATFRAKREYLGLSIWDVANDLDVEESEVESWEHDKEPESYAIHYLQDMENQCEMVISSSLEIIQKQIKENKIKEVKLRYYRSQEDYDTGNPGTASYGLVNHISYKIAQELMDMGILVDFIYIDEAEDIIADKTETIHFSNKFQS